MLLKNKKILLVVGGGISSYKSLDLIRILKKNNFQIKIILTKSGKEFVTPLSLTALSGGKVFENLFDAESESEIDHIALSRWADLIIVLPTTANFMTKLSLGKAEDLATTVILASNKDILLVPAMNVRMWLHKATQENFKTLRGYGYKFIGPESGEMACGEYGEGKMSSPRQIYTYIKDYFNNKDFFKKKRVSAIVTSGATREYLDPVRYLTNESSGKQGYEVALALSKLGIKTTLITGSSKTDRSRNLKIKYVTSAFEMLNEVKKLLPTDIVVCAAAVSDFKAKKISKSKIKKNKNDTLTIILEKNPDILESLGKSNKYRPKVLVGFSAETDNLLKNSIKKLENKHCDIIIANDVSKKDTGFKVDYNKVLIIDKSGKVEKIKKSKKTYIASEIAKKIMQKFLIEHKSLN